MARRFLAESRAAGTLALLAFALSWPVPARAGRLDRWTSEIASASQRFGIPESWIRRVIQVESGGATMRHGVPIVSRAGAMGLMQLMPATWREMRDSLRLGPDPHDPADNILAGTAYLRLMYDRFGYPGMFAAYNAGPGRYAAFLGRERALPAETRAYVDATAGVRPQRRPIAAPVRAGIFAVDAKARNSSPTIGAATDPSGLFVPLGAAVRR